jgi:hypothetical protein
MNENEPQYNAPESQGAPRLRFEEGWREILEAPDALDYQTWINDLADLTSQQINEEHTERTYNQGAIVAAWLRAVEQVADVAIDPEDIKNMSQADIVETALITVQTNIGAMGWDMEGLVFTVPNMFSGEEATIDLRELID